MAAEGVLGLIAGFAAGSIALVGWALGSAIEALANVIVVWRFTGSRMLSETAEQGAQKAVAVSLAVGPHRGRSHPRPGGSPSSQRHVLGIAITTAWIIMPVLRTQAPLGEQLGSGAIAGEVPRTS
jgi:hypothetical protein